MDIANLHEAKKDFQILQTTPRSQTAVMRLGPGEASSEEPSVHKKSDQILLVLQGTLRAEIGKETKSLGKEEVVIVPKNTPHRFVNIGRKEAVTFTAYAPPAY